MLKIENSPNNMDFKDQQKIPDNVDFESYIDAVKENQITWKFFIRLMDDLANNMIRQKLLISILLKEFKNYLNLLRTKDLSFMESVIEENNPSTIKNNSMIQKSKSNQFGIQKYKFQDVKTKESIIQKSKFNEFEMIQKSQIRDDARFKEPTMFQKSKFFNNEFEMIQKSKFNESMIQKNDDDEIQDSSLYIQNSNFENNDGNNDEEKYNEFEFQEIQDEESIFKESTIVQNYAQDGIETEITSEPNDEDHIDLIQDSKSKMNRLSSNKIFQCQICMKTFHGNRRSLHSHIKYVHEESKNDYQCHDCGKYFGQKEDLQKHFKSHAKISNYFCDNCKKGYGFKNLLKMHMKNSNCQKSLNSISSSSVKVPHDVEKIRNGASYSNNQNSMPDEKSKKIIEVQKMSLRKRGSNNSSGPLMISRKSGKVVLSTLQNQKPKQTNVNCA